MSLLIEGISVVTKKTIIEEKYRGGFNQYAEDCPNYTFCADEHLTCIMFQTFDDAFRWVRRLEIQGLVFINKGKFIETAVVSDAGGPIKPCDWLIFSRARSRLFNLDLSTDIKISVCRMTGTQPGKLAMPEDWVLSDMFCLGTEYIPINERYNRLQFVEHKDGIEVFMDNLVCEKIHIGRPLGGGDQLLMSRDFSNKGFELVKHYFNAPIFGSSPEVPEAAKEQRKINLGIQYLKESVRLHPYDWVTFWYLGKAYRAIEDFRQAYGHFKSAYNLYTKDADVYKDLMETCWKLKKSEEANSVARAALRLWPQDPEWVAYYGWSLLKVGQSQKAKKRWEKALRMNPEDERLRKRLKMIIQLIPG